MKTLDAKRVLEAALICSSQPMPLREMRALFARRTRRRHAARRCSTSWHDECKGRGVELVAWPPAGASRAAPNCATYLDRLDPEKPPRYSRAVLETLAIIAYRQPVTRGDIEDIRGVAVASSVVKQLEDRGWIEAIGYREAPGRPALLATTRQFLDDLGLATLEQLPTLEGADGEPIAQAAALPDGESQASLSFAEATADAAAEPPADRRRLPTQMPWNRTHECSRRSLVARRPGR